VVMIRGGRVKDLPAFVTTSSWEAGFRWCPGQTEVAVEVRYQATQIASPLSA